jgi:hypothetical protein
MTEDMRKWLKVKPCHACKKNVVDITIDCGNCKDYTEWAKGPPALFGAKLSDMVTELDRRKPCKRCKRYMSVWCSACNWNGVRLLVDGLENFKEAK